MRTPGQENYPDTIDDNTTRNISNPTSPARARSTGDLLQDRRQSSTVVKRIDRDDDGIRYFSVLNKTLNKYPDTVYAQLITDKATNIMDEVMNENRESKERYPYVQCIIYIIFFFF